MLINSDIEFNLISLLLNTTDYALRLQIVNEVSSEIFGDLQARHIFTAIKYLLDSNTSIESANILNAIKKLKITNFEDANILIISVKDRNITEDSVNYKDYVTVLNDLYQRRTLLAKMDKVDRKIKDPSIELINILTDLRELSLLNIKENFIISPGQIKDLRLKGMHERAQINKYYFTGFDNLDNELSMGFAPGTLSVIAARPTVGKTLFKDNIIINLCQNETGVVNFCLEQDFQAEMDRFTSIMAEIPVTELIQVWKWEEDDQRIQDVVKVAETIDTQWNMHFINKRTMTMMEAINITAFLKHTYDIKVVFFDLFDRFSDISHPTNKAELIGEKLPILLEFARILDVHFSLVVQISRTVDYRKDKRPRLSDLRSSGAFENVPDLVLLLYRDSYYEEAIIDDKFEVKIAKQKQGPTGTAYFNWEEKTMKLTERTII